MKDLPRDHKIMQAVHELLDARVPVVPMAVQDVDVVRAQLLQRRVDGQALRLGAISSEVHLLGDRGVVLSPGISVL